MKTAKRISLGLVLLAGTITLAIFLYIQSIQPKYNGELTLKGPQQEIEVLYDNYGVPHIYAESETDAYFALGYVHAQDRLFQMEILRRLGGGRLAEILGPELIEADVFFRTLGINEVAKRSVEHFNRSQDTPWHKGAMAYLNGINQFLEHGETPIEFTLLGITKEKFTPKDFYLIVGYMAFNFAPGFKTDPIITQIYRDHGKEYLEDLAVEWNPWALTIKNHLAAKNIHPGNLALNFEKLIHPVPLPAFFGSNSWVVGPAKTKNGKVILCNDTHIGFAQPSVWYEAHIESPGFSFYGNHLAGFPFGLTGHTRSAAIGITMFENDDVNFYVEKTNPDNPDQVWADTIWQGLTTRQEVIHVKDSLPLTIDVNTTRHGPIMNRAMESVEALDSSMVSVWWTYYQVENHTVEAAYRFSHSNNMKEAKEAAFLIKAPGLNIMYGDKDGNIAWWAVGQLAQHGDHSNTKLFMDGASGDDEVTGYFDPSENPQSENPPWGFVYSANNQPDTLFAAFDSGKGALYPGYYAPENRAKRIEQLLTPENSWDAEKMKTILMETTTDIYPATAQIILDELDENAMATQNELEGMDILLKWNGNHDKSSTGPVIYYKLIYKVLELAMQDELGEEMLEILLPTHLMKKTIPKLIKSANSIWWDDVTTEDIIETRKGIFTMAYGRAIEDLENQLGPEISDWQWGQVHTLEHVHPIGRKEPFDKIFNVGPFHVMGGDEVINNQSFPMNKEGQYKVTYGPAMRRIVDFSDIENTFSILPTGQSGVLGSPHYEDQAEMYNNGEFRKQLMNRDDIVKVQTGRLVFQPKNE